VFVEHPGQGTSINVDQGGQSRTVANISAALNVASAHLLTLIALAACTLCVFSRFLSLDADESRTTAHHECVSI
jgi:hypothetical protein